MKKVIIYSLFFIISLNIYAQESTRNMYSGGMLFFQPGYMITQNSHQKIADTSFGIGGILRFYLGDYFTAGIYGGTQKAKYNSAASENSYLSLGYGGPFVGISHKAGRLRYTASAFVGMGAINNLHIESQNENTLTEAYLYKNSGLVFSPIISVDYSLTRRLSLTAQAVYLTARMDENRMFQNPVFQIGILFTR